MTGLITRRSGNIPETSKWPFLKIIEQLLVATLLDTLLEILYLAELNSLHGVKVYILLIVDRRKETVVQENFL